MPYTNFAKDQMLDSLTGLFVSAHTANPGQTGASEVAPGGSPAYARKSITFSAASSGTKDSSNQPVLDIPAGTTVTYVGIWDAVTGGNFMGYKQITSEAFGNQGTLTISDVDLNINDV